MKIIDGLQIKSDRLPIEIPNVGRENLPEFFKDLGFEVGAEIGVEYGYFSESLCKGGLKVYAIDPWMDYGNYRNNRKSQKEMNSWYKETKKRLAPYDCKIIRKFSLTAVKDFEDESLDFVYIDGAHDFENVTNDIVEWSKKVRKGGVISGHDYIRIERRNDILQVKEAVDAYTKKNEINPWYVLGRKNKLDENEIRDKQRSWFWFKQ
jgi:hypothetical protein